MKNVFGEYFTVLCKARTYNELYIVAYRLHGWFSMIDEYYMRWLLELGCTWNFVGVVTSTKANIIMSALDNGFKVSKVRNKLVLERKEYITYGGDLIIFPLSVIAEMETTAPLKRVYGISISKKYNEIILTELSWNRPSKKVTLSSYRKILLKKITGKKIVGCPCFIDDKSVLENISVNDVKSYAMKIKDVSFDTIKIHTSWKCEICKKCNAKYHTTICGKSGAISILTCEDCYNSYIKALKIAKKILM